MFSDPRGFGVLGFWGFGGQGISLAPVTRTYMLSPPAVPRKWVVHIEMNSHWPR